ncbi:ROK family transcriptional regulator [Rhizocola hellebori]|nr:ROK family transcriptional regulator [Rhizocola hellebori]
MREAARRVAEMLRGRGPRTRAELISLTGLSRPTISSALTELSTAGLVTEVLGPPAGGRPAGVFRLTRKAGLAVGVDIGRRHLRVAIADLGHEILASQAIRLDRDADDHPFSALDLATQQVDKVLAAVGGSRAEVVGVGLGIPAPVTLDGRIGSPTLLPAWADLVPEEELANRLGGLTVRVDNDANLGALAEHTWGAGRDCADLVYVKIATGIGAGIVLDGRLYRGSAGTAGELGHVTLDASGPICRCGNRGCLELTAGGRALLAQAGVRDLDVLAQRAIAGDPGCRRLLLDAGRHLGIALGGLLNLINPDRIVVGEFAGHKTTTRLLLEPLRRGLAETAMAAAVDAVEVVQADLGERAAALGGVALALGVDRA